MNGCNVSFAVSQIEDCLELNFRYVDCQTLAHLSCSSCVYWISARATRAQRFLSVRESISASTGEIGCEWLQQMQREALIIASAISRCLNFVDKVLNCCCTIFGQPYVCQPTYRPHPRSRCIQSVCGWMNNEPVS